ncbi:MAG: hypothetical protein HY288_16860 [Planctomycetia bacterium]|nr:hypothetical protein [Planctomycetia bacterium]
MLCLLEWRDGRIVCSRCSETCRHITEADLAAVGGDLSKIRRVCGTAARAADIEQARAAMEATRAAAAPIVAAPSLFKRIKNFAPALITHARHGFPKCTQEQMDARHAICRACPGGFYIRDIENPNLGICGHKDCGCSAGREERFLNKLGWADQACPIGAWPAAEGM